jgi:hypothetical protein
VSGFSPASPRLSPSDGLDQITTPDDAFQPTQPRAATKAFTRLRDASPANKARPQARKPKVPGSGVFTLPPLTVRVPELKSPIRLIRPVTVERPVLKSKQRHPPQLIAENEKVKKGTFGSNVATGRKGMSPQFVHEVNSDLYTWSNESINPEFDVYWNATFSPSAVPVML